jgi:hypothetical protein
MNDVNEIKQRLVEKAKQKNISDAGLAETVIDIKSEEACEINNGGIEDQIEFLMKHMSEKEIEEAIENADE